MITKNVFYFSKAWIKKGKYFKMFELNIHTFLLKGAFPTYRIQHTFSKLLCFFS